jgi:hypothetical protein
MYWHSERGGTAEALFDVYAKLQDYSKQLKLGVKPKLTFTSRTRLSSRRPISKGFSEVSVSEIVKYSRTRNFKWKEENAFIEL